MSKSNGRKSKPRDIEKILTDGVLIDQAMREAAKAAVLAHKRAGRPIAVWRNGKAVLIKPK